MALKNAMSSIGEKALCGAFLLQVLLAADVSAQTRDCTTAEKKLADDQLKTVAADTGLQQQLRQRHLPFGLHKNEASKNGDRLLYQNGYIMLHDEDLRTSLWSSYALAKTDMDNTTGKPRVNCFRTDPRLKKAKSAAKSDYDEAIYDQGHMTNDADLKDDLLEQLNTYVLSNMSPQHCRFNRGIWLSLEHLTRAWAREHETVFITSVAIFD